MLTAEVHKDDYLSDSRLAEGPQLSRLLWRENSN